MIIFEHDWKNEGVLLKRYGNLGERSKFKASQMSLERTSEAPLEPHGLWLCAKRSGSIVKYRIFRNIWVAYSATKISLASDINLAALFSKENALNISTDRPLLWQYKKINTGSTVFMGGKRKRCQLLANKWTVSFLQLASDVLLSGCMCVYLSIFYLLYIGWYSVCARWKNSLHFHSNPFHSISLIQRHTRAHTHERERE